MRDHPQPTGTAPDDGSADLARVFAYARKECWPDERYIVDRAEAYVARLRAGVTPGAPTTEGAENHVEALIAHLATKLGCDNDQRAVLDTIDRLRAAALPSEETPNTMET